MKDVADEVESVLSLLDMQWERSVQLSFNQGLIDASTAEKLMILFINSG